MTRLNQDQVEPRPGLSLNQRSTLFFILRDCFKSTVISTPIYARYMPVPRTGVFIPSTPASTSPSEIWAYRALALDSPRTHNHGGFPSPFATVIMETFHFRPLPKTFVDHKSRAAVDTVTPPRPSRPAHASSYRSPTNHALLINVLNAGWVTIGSVPITQVITWADRVLTSVVPR